MLISLYHVISCHIPFVLLVGILKFMCLMVTSHGPILFPPNNASLQDFAAALLSLCGDSDEAREMMEVKWSVGRFCRALYDGVPEIGLLNMGYTPIYIYIYTYNDSNHNNNNNTI